MSIAFVRLRSRNQTDDYCLKDKNAADYRDPLSVAPASAWSGGSHSEPDVAGRDWKSGGRTAMITSDIPHCRAIPAKRSTSP